MKTYLKFSEPVFHVNHEQKVVTCTVECEIDTYNHPAWRLIDLYSWVREFPKVDKGKFTVKAKARCHDIDDFDETKGRHLAESRAKYKAYSIAYRYLRKCAASGAYFMEKLADTVNMLEHMCRKEDLHIAELENL